MKFLLKFIIYLTIYIIGFFIVERFKFNTNFTYCFGAIFGIIGLTAQNLIDAIDKENSNGK